MQITLFILKTEDGHVTIGSWIAGETQCQWRAERKRYPTLAGSKSQPKRIRQVSLRENTDCGTKAD